MNVQSQQRCTRCAFGMQSQQICEKKKEIAKEIFPPVIKKFDRIKIIPHYKDECWSIDLIDRSSVSKYSNN